MKVSPCIWTDMLAEIAPENAIRLIAEAGFRQVEFGLTHEFRYLEGNTNEAERIQTINRVAKTHGVNIVQMHGRLFNLCAPNSAKDVEWAHRSIKRAARLGARWVVLHPGTMAGVGRDHELFGQVLQRNVEVLSSFAETARQVGVGIAVENVPPGDGGPRFGSTASDLMFLLKHLPRENVGVCWDTGHAELAGEDQPAALRLVGGRLVALHLADNDGVKDRHWAPYRGVVDWPGIMRALREIDYQGPLNLELSGEARATPQPLRLAKMRYLLEVCRHLLSEADSTARPGASQF